MQPQQEMPMPQSDPYAFLNEKPPRNNPLSFLKGGSFSPKIILILGAFILLLIILLIIRGLVSGGGPLNVPSLESVALEQQQLILLSQNAVQNATNSSDSNYAYTMLASITSEEQSLLGFLARNGHKVTLPNAGLDPSLSSALTSAQSANNFDPVFVSLAGQQVNKYQTALSNAYNLNPSPVTQKLLKGFYNSAGYLKSPSNFAG